MNMTDLEFERYITSVIKEYGANYIDEKLIDNTPHKFSAEFERKMNILMGKSSKRLRLHQKIYHCSNSSITGSIYNGYER